MTRLLVETRLPLVHWLREDATLPEWIVALENLREDSILVAGGNERMRRTLFENLEQLGSVTASAIIDYYQKLPRTSGDGVKHDCSLTDEADGSMQNALPNLRSSEAFRQAKVNRTSNPKRAESVLESFDRILLPLAKAAFEITIVDAYASAQLFQVDSAATKIVSERFGDLATTIRLHSRSHTLLPDNERILREGLQQIALPQNVELTLHRSDSNKRDIYGAQLNFPHARVWKFSFSQGSIVVTLDKGFDSFDPNVSGVITNVSDPNYWAEEISDNLAATRIF